MHDFQKSKTADMNMLRIVREVTFGVVLISCCLCSVNYKPFLPTVAYATAGNKYHLTTEHELEAAYDRAINDYWSMYGRYGSFVGTDGVEIKYMTFIRPDERAALVIVSGRTESYIKYKELIYDLGKQRLSLYIYDHRGQGFSDRMTVNTQMCHVWDFDDYVEDLKTFYDMVVSAKRHDKLFLLAHSMGGAIASLYIETYKNDFDAVVLSSPMHEPSMGLLSSTVTCATVKLTSRVRDFFIWLFEWEPRYIVSTGNYVNVPFDRNRSTHSKIRYTIFREEYEKNQQVKLGGPTTHWVSCACDASREARKNAAQITIPVLVVQAEQDSAVTARGQDEFCINLKAGGKNQCDGGAPVIIRGAYHELFMEKDEFRLPALTKILDFFNEQCTQ